MKRAALALACLLLVAAVLLPALAFAAEKATPQPTLTSAAPATSTLITYPAPEPDATAEEAIAETEWVRLTDLMNLGFAVVGMGGIIAVVIWGIVASRRASVA